ncbi:DNA endonuclease RBBP8-like [Entelurus aequoreus]|uniref:DNA endonuclease RBBP8-like n=1 Tax=Entelurus aequoreus TaxID=161455 RepID=UPI002B1D3A4F|nr:DNA endonuclease RBBP8-like [Entelurus aequoreus]
MNSPTSTPKPTDLFHTLWKQLGECHEKTLQELEEKVSKLKKDRDAQRLEVFYTRNQELKEQTKTLQDAIGLLEDRDAQRLEVFYTRNQELKEQTKTLQDAIGLLEDRLRTGECDRCLILEGNLKSSQEQNERLITKMKHENKCLEDENRKLYTELEKFKNCSDPQEQEDGIIPDSPVLASSLPLANKLRKRKTGEKRRHVRYAEEPSFKLKSLFKDPLNELVAGPKNAKKTDILVPDTCEMETSLIAGEEENGGEVIAETCVLELVNTRHVKTVEAAGQQNVPKSSLLTGVHLKPRRISPSSTSVQSPDSTTDKSSSLSPPGKKLTIADFTCKEKQKKEDGEPKGRIPKEEQKKQTCRSVHTQSFKQPPDSKVQSVDCGSPAFKKPNSRLLDQRRNHLHGHRSSHRQEKTHTVENMWSIDPALNFSMYDSERGAVEHEEHGELPDSDCTWISHSLLQGRRANDEEEEHSVSGIGEKANDSLDGMFDATGHEEYISYNSSQVASQPSEAMEQEEDNEEEESSENYPHMNKVKHPAFAHVAVVRKKDERRKLKGTTCKECEVYYAHLPEEEKQKKLSECSRHRYRFIPPNTPEHFWEVGFPSTQTCIERGYIKEEKTPSSRLRRKQPFAAFFSPKNSQKDS